MNKKISISLILFSLLIIFSTSVSAIFGIDGYGTKNTLAKFINGEDIGNSSIVDDGNSVNVSNTIYVLGSQVCTADNGICYANGTISAGNPFDQSLNTTDNVHFQSIGTGLLFAGYLAKNSYYNYDDNINPYSHAGVGYYEIINNALNMYDVADGSETNFEYIPATTHLSATYKRIETNFTIHSNFINDYNSAVLALDTQYVCGESGCNWLGHNSCWQQYFSGVWYLGIYQCNEMGCYTFNTIASDSGNTFSTDTNNRMVFERNQSTFTCSLYDNTDTLLSSVSGSDTTYSSGYDGLMVYYANVTYDDTSFNWSSISAPMRNEALENLWNNNTWVGKVETILDSIFGNIFMQNLTANTLSASNGFTGDCINVTYSGGIAISCND